MATRKAKRKNAMAPEMFNICLVINLIHLLTRCVQGIESHSQAFVQTENELRDMGEVVHLKVIPGQNLQDISLHDGADSSNIIRFEPPMLDFGDQPVGMPNMQQVTVHNPNMENSLHLLSISGSTLHFHCSFFQDKLVPPGGNTTFDVVFLARQVGNVENTLYIHTSQGSFRYQVFGVGMPNPYRIRPFIGAKVPLNASFSPLIHMHNPHSSILQVVEMYSSGGDLHLELPTGELEASRNLWEIPPYETKPVMRANFIGRTANNHTAFIRIKTNQEQKDQVLILPVEVEVSSSPGIFSQLEMLDFGILRSQDGPKSLQLNLINSGSKPAHVTGVSVSPPNEAVTIDFRPAKLQPSSLQPSAVAQISFTASKVSSGKQWSGNIIVKTKNGENALVLPYQARVLTGSLDYNREKAKFYVGKPPLVNLTREFPITNKFNVSVAVYNYELPADARKYFTIENFTRPVMIPPQQTLSPLRIKFHPDSDRIHFHTELTLHTNVSVFNIPLRIFNGKLKVIHHRPEIYRGQLDFGTLGVEEQRSMTFTLRNENPVDIVIREYGANMDKTQVVLLGVEEGNGTMLTREHNVSQMQTSPLILKPYHFAVFSVNLQAPKMEGTFAAEVILTTQFESLYIPMTLRTAEGSLNSIPDKIVFEKAFPGKTLRHELKVSSSFIYYLEVRQVTFQPNDSRFHYERPKHRPILLEPLRESIVGHIHFNPRGACHEDCYIGLPTYIPVGQQWLLGMSLGKQVADIDQYLFTRFKQKWELIGSQQQSTVNVTVQLDTSQLRGFLFPAQAHLHWPSLARTRKIIFPLTQIGNLSITEFYLENPADVPVLMQILPLSLYPSPQTLLDLLTPQQSQDLTDYVAMDPEDEVFSLQDLELYHKSPKNPVPALRKGVESLFGVKPHDHSITMLVGGGTKLRVRLGFQPKDDALRSTLIVVRNNLTIVDTLVVRGQGGRGEMTFGGQKPDSATPLTFFLGVKHLKNCDKKKQSKNIPPSFTIRKTFVVKNTGELPFYVQGYTINDSPCEGYGFKVLECEGFDLPPNVSKKVDVAFTPDFSMSRIQRTLTVHTTLGPSMNFTLQATVPSHMLSKCSQALPRPSWEPILYYTVVCMMSFLLFSIIVASYFEADRILTADIIRRRSKAYSNQTAYDKGKVFDLRTIAGVNKTNSDSRENKVNNASSKSTPPTTITASVSNGHIESSPPSNNYKKKKSRGPGYFLFSLVRYVFSLFSRSERMENGSVPQYTKQNSSGKEKDTTKHTIGSNLSNEERGTNNNKDASISNSPPASDNVLQLRLTKGKNRSGKRQSSHENSADSTSCEKKHTKDTEPQVEATPKVHTDKDNKKSSKDAGGNHRKNDILESIDASNIADLDEIVLAAPKESKKGRKKPKVDLKPEEIESRLRVNIRRRNQDLDQDDASSTTTDSSTGEMDEKLSSARDSTPEPLMSKTKKTKSKAKNKKKVPEEMEDDKDEFVLSTKSRAHKKIKVDPRSSLGGNILRPSSLELPYTTKLEAEEAKVEPVSPHALAADIASKAIKKNLVKASSKRSTKNNIGAFVPSALPLHVHIADTDSCSDISKESPPPIWDPPSRLPSHADGDLSELSIQTEQFQKLTKPASVASEGRGSYSSIVSNGTGNEQNNRMKNNKPPALDPKSLFSDAKQLGAIGTKPVLPPSMNMRKDPWNLSPGGTPRPAELGNFGLGVFQEGQQNGPILDEDLLKMRQEELALAEGLSEGMGPIGFKFGNQPRIMQELRAERQRRLLEYQQKLQQAQQEEWPGFGGPVVSQESLWDATAAPTGTWSTITHSPPRPKARLGGNQPKMMGSNMWDTPLSTSPSQPSPSWNIQSIWSSAPPAGNEGGMQNSPGMDSGSVPEKVTPSPPAVGPEFDPFNSLATIWNTPASTASGNQPWGFQFNPAKEE